MMGFQDTPAFRAPFLVLKACTKNTGANPCR